MAQASELCEGSEWRINIKERILKVLAPAESASQTRVCEALHGFVMGFLSNLLGFFKEGWQLGKSEPKKLIHGFKEGLALSLVSLFYYMRPLYEGVGGNAMWAVMTVIAVFEYTVGETLIKCMNQATGTILAVALSICVYWIASQFRGNFEPIILQGSICVIYAATTFSRFVPSMKAHFEYVAIVFILTFTLFSLSGYREELFGMTLHRLSTIAIGTSICILTSLLFCPVWAGNELRDLIKSNIQELARSLDESIAAYFKRDGSKSETSKNILPGYKSLLDSRAIEESLASFAKWEPAHGGFKFRHPWTEYLEVGASLRSCAYCIEALNCTIDSNNTQAHQGLEEKEFSKFCVKLSSDSSTVLKELVVILETMTKSHKIELNVLEMCNTVEQVQNSLKIYFKKPMADDNNDKEETKTSSIIMEIIPLVTLSSLLIEIAGITEKMAKTVNGFAHN
ncbi:hypothetical protein CASFOL_041387 [Castilleja foliolosa]|uniref:Aluminum-activated malate transporter n=1 Tax=Castilleja foliolosa TaxID=1961234 RepID=A0ABD3BE96_9LAMI